MELILRVHDRQALVVDETVRPKDVERQVLIRMRPAFPIPLLADDSRVAVGIEYESLA